jgi:exodeoxyribonuclease V gamma subunit
MASGIQPGFLALHGNRTETLLEAVAAWLRRHPLDVLEPETVLVQNNGMAEWFKMGLASEAGICAAMTVQLPGRFIWQLYRQVLGPDDVPAQSPVDKIPLTWRLMRLLPMLHDEPGFEPIAGYLRPDDDERLFQLAQRIADLFDQYQVHRADWLDAWAQGRDVLIDAAHTEAPLSPDQRWQALLWRQVLTELEAPAIGVTRPQLHRKVIDALESDRPAVTVEDAGRRKPARLPRRVVLFGLTHVPLHVLELLVALSRHSQVILAVPNPCRFHWADVIDGREWLRMSRRRLPLRGGRDLAEVPLEHVHLHAHPLLAAWGRQARDFVRQLDVFDDAEQTRERFAMPRIDIFEEEEPQDAPLLRRVQNRIRDLVPLAEHIEADVPSQDRSIVFHVAHSPVRELEILHDQLLHLLANPPGGKLLNPRDIVVMVPDIEPYAPAIRAVFDQYPRHDARHIPFDIADLGARSSTPLMAAIEWLLTLQQGRCGLGELCALLDVEAIAARYRIAPDSVPQLVQWLEGAGIRWGLNAAHRADLDLDACGEQNTVWFGLKRMLMGYAIGDTWASHPEPFGDIAPYADVGGLEAELAGAFARLVGRLIAWQLESRTPAPPDTWAARFRSLLSDLVRPQEMLDHQTLAALETAITAWMDTCAQADFTADIPLAVAGEALLGQLDTPALNKRFRAGGVTFCTLMPMRAIPFEVVCLLGMNDGDYPRRAPRSDFDLMGLPAQRRPGDRARRDDDRQLMLEALLSARSVFYVSWCGRSIRNNSEQPPSVLISQLRDYLAAGWKASVVTERTTVHPLQAFSRRYFEPGSQLLTYAREWRAAHADTAAGIQAILLAKPAAAEALTTLTMSMLTRFLQNPVKSFFRHRLAVAFDDIREETPDAEIFSLNGLDEYQLVDEMMNGLLAHLSAGDHSAISASDLQVCVRTHLDGVRRAGRLPLNGLGESTQCYLADAVLPMAQAWVNACIQYPLPAQRQGVRFEHAGVVLEDWLDHLVAEQPDTDAQVQLVFTASALSKNGTLRAEKMVLPWIRSMLAAANGLQIKGLVIGRDASVCITPMPAELARATLAMLIDGWRQGCSEPLPIAIKTALSQLNEKGNPQETFEGSRYAYADGSRTPGEGEEPCLARLYPTFEKLKADGRFEQLSETLYGPLVNWISDHVQALPHSDFTLAVEEQS